MSAKVIEYLAMLRLQEQQLAFYADTNQYWDVDKYFNAELNKMAAELSLDEQDQISAVVRSVEAEHIKNLPTIRL